MKRGWTPLNAAVSEVASLPLTVWLLDVKGADVNANTWGVNTPLYAAATFDIFTAVLDRGGDPTLLSDDGSTVLASQTAKGNVESVARLLQDPRVRASVNVQSFSGRTALHMACYNNDEALSISIIHLLLQAGANPALPNKNGETTLVFLRDYHPTRHAATVLLERYPDAQKDAEKASKARRLAAVRRNAVAPSYLQGRVARGKPLPQVQLRRVMLPRRKATGSGENDLEAGRKLRTMAAFVVGMEGGWENAGMPQDVFRVVVDFLMPTWDPLRRRVAGAAPPLQQG